MVNISYVWSFFSCYILQHILVGLLWPHHEPRKNKIFFWQTVECATGSQRSMELHIESDTHSLFTNKISRRYRKCEGGMSVVLFWLSEAANTIGKSTLNFPSVPSSTYDVVSFDTVSIVLCALQCGIIITYANKSHIWTCYSRTHDTRTSAYRTRYDRLNWAGLTASTTERKKKFYKNKNSRFHSIIFGFELHKRTLYLDAVGCRSRANHSHFLSVRLCIRDWSWPVHIWKIIHNNNSHWW